MEKKIEAVPKDKNNKEKRSFFFKLSSFNFRIRYILFLGLALRLILMPFFGHVDINSTYTRANNIAFEGDSLFDYSQPLSHLIEVVNLEIYDVYSDKANLNSECYYENPKSRKSVFSRECRPWINFNLFVYKIPYLIFDLLVFLIIMMLFNSVKKKKIALSFYFLNPILIFAVYVFGRYETFPIFFTVYSLFLLKQKRLILSAISFSLAILTRTSFLLLVPFYILLNGKTLLDKIKLLLIVLFPYVLIFVYQTFFLDISNEANWLQEGAHTNFIFSTGISLGFGTQIFIYPLIISIVIFFLLKRWIEGNQMNDWRVNSFYFMLVFMFLFATSYYHPQYLAWFIPFLSINLADSKYRKEILYAFAILVLSFFVVLLRWHNAIIPGVIYPLSPELGSKDITYIVDRFYPYQKLERAAGSVVSGMLFVIIGYFIWEKIQSILLYKFKTAQSKYSRGVDDLY